MALVNWSVAMAALPGEPSGEHIRARVNRNPEFLRNELVVMAIVYSRNETGSNVPKCKVETTGYQELVPNFMQAAPAGTASEFQQIAELQALPTCSLEDQLAIANLRDHLVLENSQVAFAQFVGACVVGVGLGAMKNSLFWAAGGGGMAGGLLAGFYQSELYPGAPAFIVWRAARRAAIGLGTGALLGVVCDALANFTIQYLTQ